MMNMKQFSLKMISYIFPSLILFAVTNSVVNGAATNNPNCSDCLKTPVTCMSITSTHNLYTQSVTLLNNCSVPVDLRDKILQFHQKNPPEDGRDFWGDFGNMNYPIHPMIKTTKDVGVDSYLIRIALHYPTGNWVKTKLPPKEKIIITFLYNGDKKIKDKSENFFLF